MCWAGPEYEANKMRYGATRGKDTEETRIRGQSGKVAAATGRRARGALIDTG